jgi:hypothetical protein
VLATITITVANAMIVGVNLWMARSKRMEQAA